MSPYEQVRGQKNRKEILPLGEQVLAPRPRASVNQLLQPWTQASGRKSSWRHEEQSSTPYPRTSKMGASSDDCHALHTVVPTWESSRPPSFAETSI